jgi:hypothetical protein
MMKNAAAAVCALLLFALPVCAVRAQTAENTWVFGSQASIDFNSSPPTPSVAPPMNASEGTAAISGLPNTLLFYTDGVKVWNFNHTLMANGVGLMGNTSSTQSALIVPCHCHKFFIFTTDAAPGYTGLRYSMVDTLPNGTRYVQNPKNVMLLPNAAEKIAGLRIPGSNAFWVVAHRVGSNQFFAYRINNATCTIGPPVVSAAGTSYVGGSFGYGQGQMKFAPAGSLLAVAGLDFGPASFLELFQFNMASGTVTPVMVNVSGSYIPARDVSSHGFYGVEFAPNSKVLYATTILGSNVLYRYDLTLGQFVATTIANFGSGNYKVGALQRGPDGKIYIARPGMAFLSYLSNPNAVNGGWPSPPFALASGTHSNLGLPSFPAAIDTCV